MKKVVCPPCGAEFATHNDDELVEVVQKHAKKFHQHDVTRDHILKEAIVVAPGSGLKKLVCPPCGAQFKSHSEDELIEIAQTHAKRYHQHDVPREEMLKAITVA